MSLRRLPFKQALVRPTLWLGCDPVSLIVLGGVGALVGIGGGIAFRALALTPVGLLLFWLGRKGLLLAAQHDARHPWTYFRAARYRGLYRARSRWDVKPPRRRRWA